MIDLNHSNTDNVPVYNGKTISLKDLASKTLVEYHEDEPSHVVVEGTSEEIFDSKVIYLKKMKNKYWSNCKLNRLINKSISKNYFPDNSSLIFSMDCRNCEVVLP
jgi:hypothetical protein